MPLSAVQITCELAGAADSVRLGASTAVNARHKFTTSSFPQPFPRPRRTRLPLREIRTAEPNSASSPVSLETVSKTVSGGFPPTRVRIPPPPLPEPISADLQAIVPAMRRRPGDTASPVGTA